MSVHMVLSRVESMYAMPTFRMANEMLREKMLQVDRICCICL